MAAEVFSYRPAGAISLESTCEMLAATALEVRALAEGGALKYQQSGGRPWFNYHDVAALARSRKAAQAPATTAPAANASASAAPAPAKGN